MAFLGNSLGLLAWLLLLQTRLGEARMFPGVLSLSPLSSEDGVDDRSAYPQEKLLTGMPETTLASQPWVSVMSLDSVAFTPAHSFSTLARRRHKPFPTWIPNTSACGRRTARIVGGQPAAKRKWPWQVSLQVRKQHICGGSLISTWWVMTAAHCVYGHLDYTVTMGEVDLFSRKSVRIPVQDIVVHRDYSVMGTIVHDIALVLLANPVTYSADIQPVCIPEKSFSIQAGTLCWVTGWGKIVEDGRSSRELREVELSIIRHEECDQLLKNRLGNIFSLVSEGVVCAYSDRGGDACQGDSGGPLVCELNKTWVQVGIVSWGIGCGREGMPGIYTEVSYYKNWIIKELSRASRWHSAGFVVLSLCLGLHLATLVIL